MGFVNKFFNEMKQLIFWNFFSKSAFFIEIDNEDFLSNHTDECPSAGEFYDLWFIFRHGLGSPSIVFSPV